MRSCYGERKLRKRPAHELVIVAAERVTRDVGEISICQHRRRIAAHPAGQ